MPEGALKPHHGSSATGFSPSWATEVSDALLSFTVKKHITVDPPPLSPGKAGLVVRLHQGIIGANNRLWVDQ